MKIYEKPMAIIEKINVEEVITSSADVMDNNAMYEDGKTIVGSDTTIVFEW